MTAAIAFAVLQAATVAAFLMAAHKQTDRHDHERQQWQAMVGDLCQRIQAPDVAVGQHVVATEQQPFPAYVPVDDDEAFRQDLEEMTGGA